MTGITNKPEGEEHERQQLVEQQREELLPPEARRTDNRAPDAKDSDATLPEHGRAAETGAGRGTDLLDRD